ncbi:MAG TPA: AtpZ/AtpI family protein [Candidatus Saccharimonadales bacterium]|nr:AtpZ/AtpI family protein [Candidatus Saccharimonadales bacterium]
MSTSPNDRDEHQVPPKTSSTVILLLLTMGDTTWRMFVPVIGLLVLGLFVDQWLNTKPWIMIIGLILGVGLAALLVKRQFNKVKQ